MPRRKTTSEPLPESTDSMTAEQAEIIESPSIEEGGINENYFSEAPAADAPLEMLTDAITVAPEETEDEFPPLPEADIPYGEEVPTAEAPPPEMAVSEPEATAESPAGEAAAAQEPQPESPPPGTPAEERQSFYGLDFRELDRGLTPEQRQEWNSIYASYRGHSVMSGIIAGVDRIRLKARDRNSGEMVTQRMYCAVVIPFRVRILIPESEMWYEGEERPPYVLRNIPGAKIDFVIINVDREGGVAVGSRKTAMNARRYYFSTQPAMNRPGSRIQCNVLVPGPRRCLVSCNGFDLDLTQREMSYTAIPDLREMYHSGDTLDCIVKEYDRRASKLAISVKETVPNPFDGAQFRHPEQSHRQGMIAGKYAGGVFCNLPDGVTVMCNYSFHYSDADFRSGDRVILIIQRYDMNKKQIYGKIVAKC